MKITAISTQMRNANRVNISIDGSYRFSLDIFQVVDSRLKIGHELSDEELAALETESVFGKVYAQALEYVMLRPHSAREIRDYLWRKTRSTHYRSRKTGEMKQREGISTSVAARLFDRLQDKGYVDDERFAQWWIENRNLRKGSSQRKLQSELRAKSVDGQTIDRILQESTRTDSEELTKIIAKKQHKYPDRKKFTQYLMRQGFRYDDICAALETTEA